MVKVNFFDKRVIKKFLEVTAVVSGTLSFVVIFVDVPAEWKLKAGLAFLAILALTYLAIWLWSNNLNSIDINVEGSDVAIKTDVGIFRFNSVGSELMSYIICR